MQALQALVTNACRAGPSAGAPPTPRVRCCKTMRCVELRAVTQRSDEPVNWIVCHNALTVKRSWHHGIPTFLAR